MYCTEVTLSHALYSVINYEEIKKDCKDHNKDIPVSLLQRMLHVRVCTTTSDLQLHLIIRVIITMQNTQYQYDKLGNALNGTITVN